MDETNENSNEEGAKKPRGKGIRAYWIKVFSAHPKWVSERSNKKAFEQYLKDHPEADSVPDNARQGLATVKSQLRKEHQVRKKGRQTDADDEGAETEVTTTTTTPTTKPRGARATLENLEVRIDEVLDLAKGMSAEGIERVVANLRTARNAVIVMLHQV